MKVGAALSATAAVVAEFVASDKGLGYLLLQYNGNLDTPMVFAVIVLLSLIGLAVYYTVEFIERITIPWHVIADPRRPSRAVSIPHQTVSGDMIMKIHSSLRSR